MKEVNIDVKQEFNQLNSFINANQISKENAEFAKTELEKGNTLIYTLNKDTNQIVHVRLHHDFYTSAKRAYTKSEPLIVESENPNDTTPIPDGNQPIPSIVNRPGRPRIHPPKVVEYNPDGTIKKRGRGRPKGSKNKVIKIS